jgi:hypothetical protein
LSIATFKQIPKDKIYTLLLASRSSLFFVSFECLRQNALIKE